MAEKMLLSSMALFYKFILDSFHGRRIEGFRLDQMLTRCPLEHLNYLIITGAAIAVFVVPYAC